MGSPPPIQVATLGMWDTMLLMVLALVVFGPRRLPMIGRQLGKLMYEFRKASNDFKFQMEEELRNAEEADRRRKEEEERKRALAAAPPQPQLEETAAQTTDRHRRAGINRIRARRRCESLSPRILLPQFRRRSTADRRNESAKRGSNSFRRSRLAFQ